MQRRVEDTTITVPVPLHDPVARGTQVNRHPPVATAKIVV